MLANDPVTGLLTLCVAVQADLLETAHVADACAAWIAAPTASLPELLVARDRPRRLPLRAFASRAGADPGQVSVIGAPRACRFPA